mgnify:CR=1 FL=1
MAHSIIDDLQKIKTDPKDHHSLPMMTKYEFNQLISLRVTHLSRGAVPFVQLPENHSIQTNMNLRKIALQELKEGKLPYLIKRPMPNNRIEYWKVKDLDLVSVRNLLRE